MATEAPQLLNAPECKKPPGFQGALQYVDLALTRFCTGHTQVFLSDFNHL